MGLSVQDAEDVIQEVFMSLFRHLHLRRSRESLRGWIFQVAHNLALKKRLAIQKNRPLEDPDGVLSDQQADVALSPEEQLMMNEKRSCLLAVVQVLPELDRHCLRLRAEGLRYREIAEVLGISLGSVSVSLTRSLARLERAGGR
jgi:RNA polymerase sigma-70 factor (ECF subfamily)